MSEPSDYPGAAASVEQLYRLADCYAEAAHRLMDMSRKGDHLSRAPFRLNAIHAIELYLSAFLLAAGANPARLRGLQHDLTRRSQMALDSGLVLRKATSAHLRNLCASREYLIVRYAPEQLETVCEVTRLSASLRDVARQVSTCLANRQAA